jgi:hypothetical protein
LETAAFVASRLTVIISQSAAGQSHYTEIEEALLPELMMTAGLDATLVGSLERVQPDSTDYLCLTGFAQSIALVSPLPVEEVARHWKRLDLPGHVLSVGEVHRSSERRVYYLPLELGVLSIIEQLKQLLADRNVRTVGLALPLAFKAGEAAITVQPRAAGPIPAKPTTLEDSSAGANPAVSIEALSSQAVDSKAEPVERRGAVLRGVPVVQPESYDVEWPNLDQLVDDFDALDL